MKRILDAKYYKANIKKITESSINLDPQEINELYTLLEKCCYRWNYFHVELRENQ